MGGGIVSGVCHGPAALVNVVLSDDSPLVKDKEVACFSNEEEDVMKRRKVVPSTCEDSFDKVGAKYTSTKAWGDHVSVSGKLITGQNPASAASTAKAVVEALQKGPAVQRKVEMNRAIRTDSIPSMASTLAFCGGLAVLTFAAMRAVRGHTQRRTHDLEEPLDEDDNEGLE